MGADAAQYRGAEQLARTKELRKYRMEVVALGKFEKWFLSSIGQNQRNGFVCCLTS